MRKFKINIFHLHLSAKILIFNLLALVLLLIGILYLTQFREGLIEFKTASEYNENNDGTLNIRNHGIGVIFIPSGLGYFSTFVTGIGTYNPIIFKVINDSNTDTLYIFPI